MGTRFRDTPLSLCTFLGTKMYSALPNADEINTYKEILLPQNKGFDKTKYKDVVCLNDFCSSKMMFKDNSCQFISYLR